jgi:hypothetical protein
MGVRVVRLGTTGLDVTNLAFGSSALSSMPGIYGYEVERTRALETLRRALDSPVRPAARSGYPRGAVHRSILSGHGWREA